MKEDGYTRKGSFLGSLKTTHHISWLFPGHYRLGWVHAYERVESVWDSLQIPTKPKNDGF